MNKKVQITKMQNVTLKQKFKGNKCVEQWIVTNSDTVTYYDDMGDRVDGIEGETYQPITMLHPNEEAVTKYKDGAIAVVSVLWSECGVPMAMHSFPDNEEGNKKAEKLFTKYAKTAFSLPFSKEDIKTGLEEGSLGIGSRSVHIIHSV